MSNCGDRWVGGQAPWSLRGDFSDNSSALPFLPRCYSTAFLTWKTICRWPSEPQIWEHVRMNVLAYSVLVVFTCLNSVRSKNEWVKACIDSIDDRIESINPCLPLSLWYRLPCPITQSGACEALGELGIFTAWLGSEDKKWTMSMWKPEWEWAW